MRTTITVTGIEAMKRRAERMGRIIEQGAIDGATERGIADLEQENRQMPQQAALDQDTVRQRGGSSTPLVDSGSGRASGRVRIWRNHVGDIRYSIRRTGGYVSTQRRASKDSGRAIRYRAIEGSGVSRTISRDKVFGIARAGARRGQPPRPYDRHTAIWHRTASERAYRRHITQRLQADQVMRIGVALARTVVDVVGAAGGI